MNAIVFNNIVIGFTRDSDSEMIIVEFVEKHLGCAIGSVICIPHLPLSCKEYKLGSVLCVGREYHRVVERVIAGWVTGAQTKLRSEFIGKVNLIPIAEPVVPMVDNVAELKQKHTLDLARMNSVVTCLTNTLKNSDDEADKLRAELIESSNYNAIISEKCERVLKALANATTSQHALGIFNEGV